MKKALMILMICIIAATLIGCKQNNSNLLAEGNGASAVEKKAKNNDDVSQERQEGDVVIKVTMPEGWSEVSGSVLPAQYLKNTASFMVKEEHFTGTTLNEVADEALAIYQSFFDNVKIVDEIESITVDEKDARSLAFTCTVSKLDMKYRSIYLNAADKIYVITFGDQVTTFDDLNDDYEAILEAIRFETK